MKKSILRFAVAASLVFAGLMTVTSCDAPATESHEHESEHVYSCPMHPEITGKSGDKCSECGMDLIEVEHDH
jgi:hypothetical protein